MSAGLSPDEASVSVGLAPLHAIVDVDAAVQAGWRPIDLARAFLDGGARCLQIRAKGLASAALLDLTDEAIAVAGEADALVIVNDRADVARLSGASGVHVGQEDLGPGDARTLLGTAAIVGLSTHTVDQVEATRTEPVTYIAVGPVFGTRTKDTGYAAVGLELVAEAAQRSDGRPIVAIGGVTLERAPEALAAGASAVAVIGDLLVGRPDVRVREFLRALR